MVFLRVYLFSCVIFFKSDACQISLTLTHVVVSIIKFNELSIFLTIIIIITCGKLHFSYVFSLFKFTTVTWISVVTVYLSSVFVHSVK